MPLLLVNVFLIALSAACGFAFGAPLIGVMVGLTLCLATLLWYKSATGMVLKTLQAPRLTEETARDPIQLMFLGDAQQMRDLAGLSHTQIHIVETHLPLAFSMGTRKGPSKIVISNGLLKTLTRAEIAAVIGHELGHLRAGDAMLNAMRLTLSQFVTKTGLRPIFSAFRRVLPGSTLLAGVLMKPECRADAYSAALCQDPKILASALKKLERGVRAVQWSALEELPFLAEVAVVNPFLAKESYDRPEKSETAHRLAELYRLEPEERAA